MNIEDKLPQRILKIMQTKKRVTKDDLTAAVTRSGLRNATHQQINQYVEWMVSQEFIQMGVRIRGKHFYNVNPTYMEKIDGKYQVHRILQRMKWKSGHDWNTRMKRCRNAGCELQEDVARERLHAGESEEAILECAGAN